MYCSSIAAFARVTAMNNPKKSQHFPVGDIIIIVFAALIDLIFAGSPKLVAVFQQLYTEFSSLLPSFTIFVMNKWYAIIFVILSTIAVLSRFTSWVRGSQARRIAWRILIISVSLIGLIVFLIGLYLPVFHLGN
jgi:hypothetical protein